MAKRRTFMVSGKSRRREALPLSQDAGNPLKDHLLHARPRTADTTVFLRPPAPHAGLSSSAFGSIMRRAMRRTGIDRKGLPAAYLFEQDPHPAAGIIRAFTPGL